MDQEKLRQQQLAWKYLINLVEQGKFEVSVGTACELEGIVAKDEALVPGHIRDGVVSVSSSDFTNGILPCSVPAKKLKKYNSVLMDLYKTGNRAGVEEFYKEYHERIHNDWGITFPA